MDSETEERLLGLAMKQAGDYFKWQLMGKSQELKRGCRFSVGVGEVRAPCIVTVLLRDHQLNLIFSTRPGIPAAVFLARTLERLDAAIETVPELGFKSSQGRFAVQVPLTLTAGDFEETVQAICAIYDEADLALGQVRVANPSLVCTRHLPHSWTPAPRLRYREEGCCCHGHCPSC